MITEDSEQNAGVRGWLEASLAQFGIRSPREPPTVVQAAPCHFPPEVPCLREVNLAYIRAPGGSLEDKVIKAIEVFSESARHLESQHAIYSRAVFEGNAANGLPQEVQQVVSEGTYTDAFLTAFDGNVFPIFSQEVAPGHEYRFALEVHTGGKYWANVPVDDVQHRVEVVGALQLGGSTASAVSLFGSAQRGAVLVWRWHHVQTPSSDDWPTWLVDALQVEGNDPLCKLQAELELLGRWVQQQQEDTVHHIRQSAEVKDPYIRELLRLWPSEFVAHGAERLKKTAWIEGLQEDLFLGKTVLITLVPYDENHSLALHAVFSRKHVEEKKGHRSPPYRLTTSWRWTASARTPQSSRSTSAELKSSSAETPSQSREPTLEFAMVADAAFVLGGDSTMANHDTSLALSEACEGCEEVGVSDIAGVEPPGVLNEAKSLLAVPSLDSVPDCAEVSLWDATGGSYADVADKMLAIVETAVTKNADANSSLQQNHFPVAESNRDIDSWYWLGVDADGAAEDILRTWRGHTRVC